MNFKNCLLPRLEYCASDSLMINYKPWWPFFWVFHSQGAKITHVLLFEFVVTQRLVIRGKQFSLHFVNSLCKGNGVAFSTQQKSVCLKGRKAVCISLWKGYFADFWVYFDDDSWLLLLINYTLVSKEGLDLHIALLCTFRTNI